MANASVARGGEGFPHASNHLPRQRPAGHWHVSQSDWQRPAHTCTFQTMVDTCALPCVVDGGAHRSPDAEFGAKVKMGRSIRPTHPSAHHPHPNPICRKEGTLPTISTGSPCPDFTLPDDTGTSVSLVDLRGKPFVLFFYPKDDTSGCTLEATDFSRLKSDFDSLGVAVLGASPDPVKKHAKFRDKHELTVPLLADEEKILFDAFGVWVQKSMYGKTYMGVERTTALVDAEGTIVRLWPKVKVPGHAEEVLAAARELGAS